MSTSHLSRSRYTSAILSARRLSYDRAGQVVLRDVSVKVGPRECLGVVGPNGVGKSTLLQILGGLLAPDEGTLSLDPPSASIGYLAQEHERRVGESVRDELTRRTGVAEAERALVAAATDLASHSSGAEARHDQALSRLESLGARSLDARMAVLLKELGVSTVLEREGSALSGGQEAKVALASIELSSFDVVLLDEPTNDLDFEGLARLERWVRGREGATVIVSHDRAFLERTVTKILELDEHDHTSRSYAGGWAGYRSERANAQRLAREAYAEFQRQKSQLTSRAARQRQWTVEGVRREIKNPTDHDTAQRDFRINRTEQLAHKARQSERALERLAVVEKPFEGWDLRFSIDETARAGDVVARLRDAIVDRGNFRLGPLSWEISWADRIALSGANGSGKSTLLEALLATTPLSSGERWVGPSVVAGSLGQDRRALQGDHDLVRYVGDRCALTISETRSLLAKFGLGESHVSRSPRLLSPGERTRVELAIFQGRGVNLLVLDEPTNHLDLAAIEQLEQALESFAGTLVLTTHDRRLMESIRFTRHVEMVSGTLSEKY